MPSRGCKWVGARDQVTVLLLTCHVALGRSVELALLGPAPPKARATSLHQEARGEESCPRRLSFKVTFQEKVTTKVNQANCHVEPPTSPKGPGLCLLDISLRGPLSDPKMPAGVWDTVIPQDGHILVREPGPVINTSQSGTQKSPRGTQAVLEGSN